MADTLNIYGVTYTGVAGIKAKDNNDNTLTYTRVSGTKSITENGNNIDVASYEKVNVAVPGTTPTGTKNITITSNTTTTEDVTNYATASIVTNVPNTYTQSDEGKVVSNGALVAQTAHADVTPTTSDQTIDTTLNNSLKVKGDANLVAGNIKKDVVIFNTTGSYEGSGGSDISSINMFSGVAFNSGYISSSGTVSAAGNTKEVYSDEIDIESLVGSMITLLYALTTTEGRWTAFAYYKSDHSFLTRNTPNNFGACPGVSVDTVPANAKYVRVSFRTYGEIGVALLKLYDFYNFMDAVNATMIES